MLTRWQSLGGVRTEWDRLHEEMNRLFDRWAGWPDGANRLLGRAMYPALNLWEDDGYLYVEAELPGLELSDLEIYVTGENQLSIKGERKQLELESGNWHRQERGHGSFSRMIELPNNVEADKVSAEFQLGVLTIALPKCAKSKPRRITVKSE